MKKVLLIVMLFIFSGVINSYAFCIYNQTDTKIAAVQISGGRDWHNFSKIIAKNSKECCNWKNKDCNVEGKRNSRVGFNITTEGCDFDGGFFDNDKVICNIYIPAGGAVVVKGSNGHYQCVGYGY